MTDQNLTPNEALTELLSTYIRAKSQIVDLALQHHPEPGHLREDLASGNLKTQILVDDEWLRIIVLIAGTSVPIEQPLLHFKLPAPESLQ